MNISKILTSVVIMMIVGLNAGAQSTWQEYNLLCNFRDGGSALIELQPRASFTGTSPSCSIAFDANTVKICADRSNPEESMYEFTFDRLDYSNPFSLVDKSFSSIETESAQAPGVIITPEGNGVVHVMGSAIKGKDDIRVYDISGRPADSRIEATGGIYTVSLAGCPSGVYIVTVSGVTIKVLKK